MLQQMIIFCILYAVGLLFIMLFYPRISIAVAVSSGLFWGALINAVLGIVLGLLGVYSWLIWLALGISAAGFLAIHIHNRAVWKAVPWKTILASMAAMFTAYGVGILIFGESYQFLTSSASLPYIVFGSHINHYGSILLPGAGYFFRSHYGISEALIYALGGFFNIPLLTLWHPLLWISQFAFCAAVFFDYTKLSKIDSRLKNAIGLVIIIWVATASMNWLNSFYVHINLLATFSVLVFNYFFLKTVNSKESRPDLGLLGTLALCLFGLGRVESPVVIIMSLAFLAFEKQFTRQEIQSIYYPPLILKICWLIFLFFGYRQYETQYWSDSRLLLAIGIYGIFLVNALIWEKSAISLKSKSFTKLISIGMLAVPIVLYALNPNKLTVNLFAMLTSAFGSIEAPGQNVWNFFWVAALIAIISILAARRPWENSKKPGQRYSLAVNFSLGYLITILVLGFIRTVPYDGTRWGDSASRMIAHIAPLIGVLIGVWIVEIIAKISKEKT